MINLLLCLFLFLVVAGKPLASAQGQGFFPPENGKVVDIDGGLLRNLTVNSKSDDIRMLLFYASWCGHCASFASQYEAIAEAFAGVPSLTFFAIDCNQHRDACGAAGVDRYPTLMGFRNGERTGEVWDRQISAAEYVNVQLPEELRLSTVPKVEQLRGTPVEMEKSEVSRAGKPGGPKDRMHDSILAFANLMSTAVFPAGVEALEGDRLDALKYVVLPSVATLYPNEGFRGEVADIRNNLSNVYSLTRERWMSLLAEKPFLNGQITLDMALMPAGQWKLCGQLSCGLWQFLHYLTLGVDRPYNEELSTDLVFDHTGLAAMEATKTIVSQYFKCDECSRHFVEDYGKCLYDRCVGGDAPTREQTVMWLWRFHNSVSARVFQYKRPNDDAQESQWPSASQCPACLLGPTGGYSEKVVYHWLVQAYLGDTFKTETMYTPRSPLSGNESFKAEYGPSMGVKNLLQYLKGCTATNKNISEFKGQRVGIDAMCWMHRGAIACCFELVSGKESDKFLTFFLRMIALLQGYDVTPVVVFDGCRMPGKAEEEKKRSESRTTASESAKAMIESAGITQASQMTGEIRTKCMQAIRITKKMIRKVMCALRALGVEFIVAAYEADAQLGYMYSVGLVDAVISEDSDVLAYGCKLMIAKLDQAGDCQVVNFTWALQGGSKKSKESDDKRENRLPLKELRNKYGADLANLRDWTKDMFIDACVLAGCDYSHACNLNGMGIKTAMKLINKYRDWQRALRSLKMEDRFRKQLEYDRFETFRKNFELARSVFFLHRVFDPKTEICKSITDDISPILSDNGSLQFSGASVADVVGDLVDTGIMKAKICARTGSAIDFSAATEGARSTAKVSEAHSKRVAFNKMEFAALTRFQEEYEQLRKRREEQRRLEKETVEGAEKAREKKGEELRGRDSEMLIGLARALKPVATAGKSAEAPTSRGEKSATTASRGQAEIKNVSQCSAVTVETTVEDTFEAELLGGLSNFGTSVTREMDEEEFDMEDLLNDLTADDGMPDGIAEARFRTLGLRLSYRGSSAKFRPGNEKHDPSSQGADSEEDFSESVCGGASLPPLPRFGGSVAPAADASAGKRQRTDTGESSTSEAKKPRASFAVFDRDTWRKQTAKAPAHIELVARYPSNQ
ncbi:Rad2 nuclease [Perkinsus chesapeaki]|uniref:Multifunctional fusion protein n=1 Tax=Perkinsus chesapeaki TaxID=330153 RepID=A0A7J6MRM1_PERCH|nr:Rad2 nuclease [Perkinsus chesapeaki]